jgi:outer membrane protein assembly complex protein YaeT
MRALVACLFVALSFSSCTSTTAVSSTPGQTEQAVAVDFEGNDGLSDRELYRHIEDTMIAFAGDPSRVAGAFDAAQDLEDYYRTRGYPDIDVRHKIDREPELRLIFTIKEGPEVTVAKIDLEGNQAIATAELLELWSQTASGVLGLGAPYFVAADLRAFAASIVARYRSSGYLDATVTGPSTTRSNSTTAAVQIRITEGPLYLTKDIFVDDALQPPAPLDLNVLLAKPYDLASVRALRIRLQRSLENHGFAAPAISVVADIDRTNHTVTVRFRGSRGERQRITGVSILGNLRTSQSWLESLVQQPSNSWYDGDLIERSVQNLYATGLFQRVSVQQTNTAKNEIDLDFLVEEAQSRELSFLLGWGSYERARTSIYATENNLFGLGQRLRIGGIVSTKSWGTDATWTEPSFLGTDTSMTVTGSLKEREEPSFTDVTNGITTAFSRRLFAATQGRVGYSLESRDARDVDPSVAGSSLQTFEIGSVFAEIVYDDRDSPLFPSEGSRYQLRYERAGDFLGGRIDLSRVTLGASWHVPLPYDDWTIGASYELGLVWALDNNVLPVQERFFNGGNDSVRSFRESQLGPKNLSGITVGGEYRNIASLEMRFPIFRALQGAVFADAGNVGISVNDFGSSNLRFGLGAGLRLALPIGPLRIDYAHNPNANRLLGERSGTLHISVGLPF